jgi:uncharacterized protein
MPAVSNSSPLIFLAAIGQFQLLHEIYGEILVPPAVWRETVAAGAGRTGAAEVRQAPWIRHQAPSDQDVTSLLLEILDSGEAEAIALAMSLGPRIPVVLDDLRARRVAEEIGLVVTGTAGILVQAKGMGLIPAFGPMLIELRTVGLYLSDSAIERLLQLANER